MQNFVVQLRNYVKLSHFHDHSIVPTGKDIEKARPLILSGNCHEPETSDIMIIIMNFKKNQ